MDFGLLAWGDPSDPLALLIHGYPDTAWTWRHLGPHLAGAAGGRLPRSPVDTPRPTLRPTTATGCPTRRATWSALHEALGGDERATLVGHDWGAVATWAVTSSEPDRFASCVAMSVPPPAAIVEPLRSVSTLPLAARQLRMSWYFLLNQLPEIRAHPRPGDPEAVGGLVPGLRRNRRPRTCLQLACRTRPAPGRTSLLPKHPSARNKRTGRDEACCPRR